MNSSVSARPSVRRRWAPIVPGILALLGSFAITEPAQAGDYDVSYYGYPAYHRYPVYPYRRYGCYSCGSHLVYERRYVEREYVERRYGYGYRRYHGCYAYGGCRPRYGYYPYRHTGYYPYAGYGSRPWGYGYAGVGRRWPAPYLPGYGASGDGYGEGYEEPPRPPAPVVDDGNYDY